MITHDEYGRPTTRLAENTVIYEYDASNNPIYLGKAPPGSSSKTDKSIWQIRKQTYDASNNLTRIEYANGSREFNFIWDNRASLSYS